MDDNDKEIGTIYFNWNEMRVVGVDNDLIAKNSSRQNRSINSDKNPN